MTEEQLYVLYNICKKKDRLDKYFSKEINVKRVEEIVSLMQLLPDMPEWYNKYTISAKHVLNILLETQGKRKNIHIEDLRAYWNVQRCYQGIQELVEKDAIFSVLTSNQKIVIRMSTYIVIDYLRKAFEDLGYVTNEKVLNAASFGVPQTRERFLLVGVSKDFKEVSRDDIHLPEPIIEAARLQSFPDTYKFYGTKDSVYQQIGNAVPPLLGRAVAETVLDMLGNQEDYTTLKELYDEKKNR